MLSMAIMNQLQDVKTVRARSIDKIKTIRFPACFLTSHTCKIDHGPDCPDLSDNILQFVQSRPLIKLKTDCGLTFGILGFKC